MKANALRARKLADPTARNLDDETAADFMTADPVVVDATASLAEALEIMRSLEIRHLPVMDGKRLAGILSDRDFAGVWGLPAKDQAQRLRQTVRTIMNTDVISVGPDTPLTEIIDTLLDQHIGAVPVVDWHREELLGIVSYVDILRNVRRELKG